MSRGFFLEKRASSSEGEFFSSSFFRPPLLGPSSSFEGEREREREERGGCFPFSSSLLLFLLIRHTRIQNSNSLFFEEGWKEGGEPERVLFPFCRSPGRAAAFFFFPFLSLSSLFPLSFFSLSSLFLLSLSHLFSTHFRHRAESTSSCSLSQKKKGPGERPGQRKTKPQRRSK